MNGRPRFAHHFKSRMLVLAVITGIFMSVSMPLTYLALSLRDQKLEAMAEGEQLSRRLADSIRENPLLWEYNAPKFTRILAENKNSDIDLVRIYNRDKNLLDSELVSQPSFLDISSYNPILYNNQVYGYIEVEHNINDTILITSLLFLVFGGLGIMTGFLLYRFPARIVTQAEENTVTAFHEINHQSRHDPLTNLPNRIKLNEQLQQALENAKITNGKFAVMYLDLDRFKLINDTFGHTNGDILLRAIANRLSDCMKDGEFIARQGGDEFIIFMPNFSGMEQLADRARELIEKLNQVFVLDGVEFYVTTSIGICIYPNDGDDITTLVKNADAAMYRAKEQGKNKYYFYNPSLNKKPGAKLSLEKDLRNGLERGELLVYYQPIVDFRSNTLCGSEALVRWQHPELGLLTPESFIDLAEETGLIIPLGRLVLRTACLHNKSWQDAGLPRFKVSVNLSATMFQQLSLLNVVSDILMETGLNPQYLQLEITENIAMYNEERVIPKLHALKNLGIHIAVDDFGTGYSSLNYLKRFPVDSLKIDQSFIRDLLLNRSDTTIVNAIIAMAQNLSLDVIAEGVETGEQRDFLITHGCFKMQGYLLGKPMSESQFERFLRQQISTGSFENQAENYG